MTDDQRQARIGRNEALFREVNERIEDLNRGFAAVSDGKMHVVCECGEHTCVDQLVVTPEEYEEVRADPLQFLVKPGHEILSSEDVVAERSEYLIVAKKRGIPRRIARETDPRR